MDFDQSQVYAVSSARKTEEFAMRIVDRHLSAEPAPKARVSRFSIIRRVLLAATAALLLFAGSPASAQSLRQGIAAFDGRNYAVASRIFIPLARRGNASAQTYLGFLFETGRGVPQNYPEAAIWYRCAAEQGDSLAQYSLGLLYDKGQGVPLDVVEAAKWLNLSAASAPPRARESRARIRDAIATKMTRDEIAQSQYRALAWTPVRAR
jgi:uncharacterized protein